MIKCTESTRRYQISFDARTAYQLKSLFQNFPENASLEIRHLYSDMFKALPSFEDLEKEIKSMDAKDV